MSHSDAFFSWIVMLLWTIRTEWTPKNGENGHNKLICKKESAVELKQNPEQSGLQSTPGF